LPVGISCTRFEFHLRASIVEQRSQLDVLCVAQVALRLHHEKVRRQTDVEPALLGFEAFFRELPGGRRSLDAFTRRLDLHSGVGDVSRHLQLDLPRLCDRLPLHEARARRRSPRPDSCRADS
jgi:hypothetical protein